MLKGKHIVAEIGGVRCSVVESGITDERVEFLKEILELNGYEVKADKEKGKDGSSLPTSVIGVTDILFSAMVSLYERKLFTKDHHVLNPAFWNQWPEETWDVPYYIVVK
jgi:hypothetical protein